MHHRVITPVTKSTWVVLIAALLLTSPVAWARRTAASAPANAAVVRALRGIERTFRSGRYDHATRIDVAAGHYAFDCSVMVAWVLRRAAPAAAREVEISSGTTRPLARHFQRHLSAPPARSAWRAIRRVADARPGDVIAWSFPAWVRTNVTGHVAFVAEAPRVYAARPNTFVLRIADSSSVAHDRDTREHGRFRGFGYGDIYVQVDPVRGTPVAYRPNLRAGSGFLRTTISLARPVR